jgi:endonuclease
MKEAAYHLWLQRQQLQENTINTQMYRADRVEQYCGNLDEHYSKDRMAAVLQMLTYSTDDERRKRPNPTPIPIDGNLRSNLASYRDAAKRYRSFRETDEAGAASLASQGVQSEVAAVVEEEIGQRISLERDMQNSLRSQIAQLESGLTISDDGTERPVESGFIDITARDADGSTVVIELKAGAAGQRAVGQILSYMGDVAAEDDVRVRGILVASDFDHKAKAAARMVPNLTLRKYSIRFTFSDGND